MIQMTKRESICDFSSNVQAKIWYQKALVAAATKILLVQELLSIKAGN